MALKCGLSVCIYYLIVNRLARWLYDEGPHHNIRDDDGVDDGGESSVGRENHRGSLKNIGIITPVISTAAYNNSIVIDDERADLQTTSKLLC